MDNSLHDSLYQRCLADREKGLTASILKDLKQPGHQLTLTAVFYYDVSEGGFERFIYNANGVYLPEVAEVLDLLNASNAVKYLDQAIQLCIDSQSDYQAFLQGDFSDSEFKSALNAITQAYRDSEQSLIVEIPETLSKLLRQR